MKRKDVLYEKLLELGPKNRISASELANMLGLGRANVSSDLNGLWKEGRIEKAEGRPTLFYVKQGKYPLYLAETALDKLARSNKSLITSIEQAKAAVPVTLRNWWKALSSGMRNCLSANCG